MNKWKYKLENEGKQLRKLINEGNETLETIQVSDYIDVPKNRISKVITKMTKEGSIFILDYLDYMGNKIFGTW